MAANRDIARGEIARRQLAASAIERIVRACLTRAPINVVERARQQLRRFFSDGSWTTEDDRALAAIVGPGDGWNDESMATDLTVSYGWRAGTFRVDAALLGPADDGAPSAEEETTTMLASAATGTASRPPDRTLGDTFEDTVLLEAGGTDAELRVVTGPGSGGVGTFTRAERGDDPRIAALFEAFVDLTTVQLGAGSVTVAVDDPECWPDVVVALYETITTAFVPPRPPAAPDRQMERARQELRGLSAGNPRDLAKLLDATTSPDAAYRRVAIEQLAGGESLATMPAWKRALEDSSRAVRRAALRAMAATPRPGYRVLFEQALADKDACCRYYAVRGIGAIGIGPSLLAVDRRLRDDDVRVRFSAAAVRAGRVPA